mgnify:FL=1
MNYFNVDAIIVYAFLLLTLLLGLWAGKNVKTIKEYAIANRAYGTGVLTITMLATFITGSQSIGYVGYIYDDGILPVIPIIFCRAIIGFLFIAHYISPKILYFEGCLTLAEVMGKLYGGMARTWIGFLGVLYCLAFVILQIIWIGYIGELINVPNQWGMLLGGAFLVIYSARGGMKSITITDILQFISITMLVTLAVNVLIHKIGGIDNIFNKVPTNTFKIIQNPNFKNYLVYCLWGAFPSYLVSFPFIQRMLMAKDKRQLAKSQYIGMSYLTIFYISLTLIGLAAIALKTIGDVNMPKQGSKVFIYLVKAYFPVGIKGIISIGLLAAVMSTADSFLHSAGILIAYDVVQPLLAKKYEVNVLRTSQYATFFLGVVSLGIALIYHILPRVQYGTMDLGKGINILRDFVAVVFTIPLLAGIMGLKTDAKSFFVSMLATFIAFFVGKLFLPDLWFMPMVIAVNSITFFAVHYIQNKGFVTVKRDTVVLS